MTEDEIASVRQRRAELLIKWDALSERENALSAERRALMQEFDRLPLIVINPPLRISTHD